MKKLKTIFSIVAFTLAVAGVSYGQGLGFKAGLNMSKVKLDPDLADLNSKIGFQVGAFYELAAGDALFVKPGLSFSTKGTGIEELDGDLSFSYLDIPIDVVYKLDVGENKLGIHAGPYLAMLLSAENPDGDDIKDEVKGTDFGINFGVGYELQNILIDINYGLGLTNIDDTGDDDAPSIKNTNISLTVGYRL